MGEITLHFEELPLGGFTAGDGLVCQYEITAWGRAVIEYGPDNWIINHIEIDASAKVDGRWVTRSAPLERHDPLWSLVSNALVARASERIEERIVDQMRGDGLLPWNPNAEHSTLNHAQQGIGQ